MRIYLAGRYSRKEELRKYAEELEKRGHVCTSEWLYGDYPRGADGLSLEAPNDERTRVAEQDRADIERCDVFIGFMEPPRSGGRGGRHVEMGMALALKKMVFIVGPAENVFCCLPEVVAFENFESALAKIEEICKLSNSEDFRL